MRTAQITRFFGDGQHQFRLAIGQCIELQETFDCGLLMTLDRVTQVRVSDIKAVLRLGLIGGGMAFEPAHALVESYCVPGTFIPDADLAADIVKAALRGAPDEDLGEPQGEMTADLSPGARFDTPTSTASPAPPASVEPIS